MTDRYAIYFAPDDSSELGLFGATVLRRQALDASDWLNPQLSVEFPATSDWAKQIRKPAHYGFHATLKAPFELAEGQSVENLLADVTQFSSNQKPLSLEGLAPVLMSGYHYLAFTQQPEAVRELAIQCVTQFEQYRAPLVDADIQRRNPDSLSSSQLDNLHRYGYPHVLSDFNFHMTLSVQNDHEDPAYLTWLTALYEAMVVQTPVIDRLAVFHQPDRNTPFIRIRECFFTAAD